MREILATQLKNAMKDGDKRRLSTIRLIQAAIKDRDIANRGAGKDPVNDEEIMTVLAKMVKQREESARIYEEAGRLELAEQEREEIAIIMGFMPQQMGEAEVSAAIDAAIASTGAAGMKDMGKVMAAMKEKFAGRMDFGKASAAIKAKLAG